MVLLFTGNRWTEKFAALEFIEFHAVNDEETCVKRSAFATAPHRTAALLFCSAITERC
jgi:hypothetical protein